MSDGDKQIRFGIGANWFAHAPHMSPDTLRDVILTEARAIKADGYDDVELPTAHAHPWIEEIPLSFWNEIGSALREIGIEPVSVHGPYYPRLCDDKDEATRKLARHAQAVAALGSKAMVIHPVNDPALHVTPVMKKAMQWDVEISLAISDALGDSGTSLAIENVTHNSFRYLEVLLSKLDRPNIGMCFDTGHYHCRPEHDIETIVNTFGSRIVHLHLCDNDSLSDQHLPPGEGTFPFDRFFKAFDAGKIGYHLMLELSAPMLQQDAEANAKTRAIYRDALEVARPVLMDGIEG